MSRTSLTSQTFITSLTSLLIKQTAVYDCVPTTLNNYFRLIFNIKINPKEIKSVLKPIYIKGEGISVKILHKLLTALEIYKKDGKVFKLHWHRCCTPPKTTSIVVAMHYSNKFAHCVLYHNGNIIEPSTKEEIPWEEYFKEYELSPVKCYNLSNK
jgi:hypothetical protein